MASLRFVAQHAPPPAPGGETSRCLHWFSSQSLPAHMFCPPLSFHFLPGHRFANANDLCATSDLCLPVKLFHHSTERAPHRCSVGHLARSSERYSASLLVVVPLIVVVWHVPSLSLDMLLPGIIERSLSSRFEVTRSIYTKWVADSSLVAKSPVVRSARGAQQALVATGECVWLHAQCSDTCAVGRTFASNTLAFSSNGVALSIAIFNSPITGGTPATRSSHVLSPSCSPPQPFRSLCWGCPGLTPLKLNVSSEPELCPQRTNAIHYWLFTPLSAGSPPHTFSQSLPSASTAPRLPLLSLYFFLFRQKFFADHQIKRCDSRRLGKQHSTPEATLSPLTRPPSLLSCLPIFPLPAMP